MRTVRTILGILLLTIGLPLLLAGAGLWTAMQHRDAGGAFSGDLEDIQEPGYAVVVPDVNGLLRRQAPFARGEQTRLRLTAQTASGPAFIGMAPPADAARFLAGVEHTRVDEVKVTRGDLPVRAAPISGEAAPASAPGGQRFWLRSGTGALEWSPSATRGRPVALIVMAADGQQPGVVSTSAELRPGWLNSSTWGLLVLGSVMLLLGILFLAWPTRAREVVYVVDPSQVPDIAARLGVSVPALSGAGESEPGAGRPATLAESAVVEVVPPPWSPPVSPPVVPKLDWPPVPAPTRDDAGSGAALAGSGASLAGRAAGLAGRDATLAGSDAQLAGRDADSAGWDDDQPGRGAGGAAQARLVTDPVVAGSGAGDSSLVGVEATGSTRADAQAGQTVAGQTVAGHPDAGQSGSGTSAGAAESVPLAPAPPPVIPAGARRRRANAAPEQGKTGNELGDRRAAPAARAEGQQEAPTGAGIAAAVAAGERRPGRPRAATKAKPAEDEADQPVA